MLAGVSQGQSGSRGGLFIGVNNRYPMNNFLSTGVSILRPRPRTPLRSIHFVACLRIFEPRDSLLSVKYSAFRWGGVQRKGLS